MLHLTFAFAPAHEDTAQGREEALSEEGATYAAPLAEPGRRYLQECIAPLLEPIDDTFYRDGLSVLLQTAARSAYVLHGAHVYWCVEWDPGLLVVQVDTSADGRAMRAVAVRSPEPDFGGRLPLPEDEADYDPELLDPQRQLIFDAWAAAHDDALRAARGFVPADLEVRRRFAAACSRWQEVSPGAREQEQDRWRARALTQIGEWAGDGVRIPSETVRRLLR